MRDFSEMAWWRETRRAAVIVVTGLVILALLPALLAGHLGDRIVLGLRFGTFVGAVVVPLAALAATLVFVAWQRGLDRRHNVSGD